MERRKASVEGCNNIASKTWKVGMREVRSYQCSFDVASIPRQNAGKAISIYPHYKVQAGTTTIIAVVPRRLDAIIRELSMSMIRSFCSNVDGAQVTSLLIEP